MNDCDEKTQVWLLRTQAIRRTPALRGGVETDHRARRQTLLSVTAVLCALLALMTLAPRLQPSAAPTAPAAPAALPASVRAARSLPPPPAPGLYAPPSAKQPAPAVVTAASLRPLPPLVPRLRLEDLLPPAGHVPPSAPVWLDGPGGRF